jgi:hypothetical protein
MSRTNGSKTLLFVIFFTLDFKCVTQDKLKVVNDIIGLHDPLDGVTNPEYKLLHFIQLTIFLQK